MSWAIYSFAIAGFFVFAANLLIALLIFFKNPAAKVNRLFSLFFASVSIYGLGFFRQAISSTSSQEMVSIKILLFGTILIPIFFVHATYAILNKKIYAPILLVIYLLGGVFEILNIFTGFFAGTPIPKFGLRYVFQAGPLYPVLALGFAIAVAVSIWKLVVAYRSSKGADQNKYKYLLLGMAVGFSGGSVGFLLGYNINLFPINPFSTYCVVLGNLLIGYAIVKYRLMDINIVLTRAGIFAVVYSFVLGIPFWVGYKFLGVGIWMLIAAFMAIFATFGSVAYNYLRGRAENTLLQKERRRQDMLYKASQSLTLIKDLDKLLKFIAVLTKKILKVEYSAVFISDKNDTKYRLTASRGRLPELKETSIFKDSILIKHIQQYRKPIVLEGQTLNAPASNPKENTRIVYLMHNMSAQVIIPAFLKEALLGFVILGNKTQNESYTEADLLTLSNMALYSALAIENVQFIKEREEFQAKLREAEKLKGIAQMMYSLNHELRNVFNKMSVPVQMIEMGEFDNNRDAFDNALKTISDNIDLGVEILAYVQSYSTKSKSNELKPKNLEETIDKATAHFIQRFKDADITLTKQIQPNLPTIQGKDTFDDLFKNILANCYFALTDQPREQRLIDIQVKLSNGDSTLQIKVSDTGPDMTKITSYTAETDSPFKERGKLGGVNLFLVYIIANDHNSKLTFEPYEKGGTAFIVNMPITQ